MTFLRVVRSNHVLFLQYLHTAPIDCFSFSYSLSRHIIELLCIMRKLSNAVVDGIRSDIKAGMTTRRITHKYAVSQSIVSRILREYEPDTQRTKAGRPGRVTLATRRLMVRSI